MRSMTDLFLHAYSVLLVSFEFDCDNGAVIVPLHRGGSLGCRGISASPEAQLNSKLTFLAIRHCLQTQCAGVLPFRLIGSVYRN